MNPKEAIAMVFSALRLMEDGSFEDNITCLDEDYDIALAASQNLPARTTQKYIAEWCREGQLVHIAQGNYDKA